MIIPNWPAPKNIKAVSSTRVGGVSTGKYHGLNVGAHVGDDICLVERNRRIFARQTGMPSAPVWLNQTHSTDIVRVEQPSKSVIDADGSITRTQGVVCCAMTADCLPVLVTDIEGSQVAAVHAGWRGLANGIVENALAQFDKPVMAWLGPGIGQSAFEVGDDVVEAFVSHDTKAMTAFTAKKDGKWLADMPKLAKLRLAAQGVEHIYDSGLCTYQNPTQFYSYRRDGVTGRLASFIWID
ncbi:peptidoglycan editing factor PgeF [Vibrio sp. SCSIO 43136]|uniref:peptidoglycan editing factor PgeF n=1 Tax=Vibrio sp. SCSIO 43136 TaxID=2819101 RepID=UPI0020764323|nr:peptidoglycan editing factor PgeF [Vibrio sp. SCSIO 43136]USD65757.1 peptidoglycan editing factor PgeF [Vibrio sp. SCSIO 43136]